MNCKPGDLAYLSSDCVAEGVVVEVLSAGPSLEDGPMWHCKSRTLIYCDLRSPDGLRVKGSAFRKDICIADKYLRPISGVPIEDEVTNDIKEPA